jgi:lipopolysaccharide export system permease protein
MMSMVQARRAEFGETSWILRDVERIEFRASESGAAVAAGQRQSRVEWPTSITPEMVSVALLKPERMRTLDLFQYIRHLESNGQTSQPTRSSFGARCFIP